MSFIIYLETNRTKPLPLEIPVGNLRMHKIVMTHGAKEACKDSADNVFGA